MYAENESFRVHLRDAFSTEIIVLDASSIATESCKLTSMITSQYILYHQYITIPLVLFETNRNSNRYLKLMITIFFSE